MQQTVPAQYADDPYRNACSLTVMVVAQILLTSAPVRCYRTPRPCVTRHCGAHGDGARGAGRGRRAAVRQSGLSNTGVQVRPVVSASDVLLIATVQRQVATESELSLIFNIGHEPRRLYTQRCVHLCHLHTIFYYLIWLQQENLTATNEE